MKISQLLNRESKWCKRVSAKDARNRRVDALSAKAVQWCLLGAVKKCYPVDEQDGAIFKLKAAANIHRGFLSVWQDEQEWPKVRAVIRKAGV